MQVCSAQAGPRGKKTFLPPRCTLFRRSVMAFERVLHVASGSNSEKSSDHNLMVASRDLLSDASDVLGSLGVAHKVIQPHEASHRSRPVLPHLLCTGYVPDARRDDMCCVRDLQLLDCDAGLPLGVVAAGPKVAQQKHEEHFRIVVVPDEWIVESIPAVESDNHHVCASQLTGFARLELIRLMWACPDAMLIRTSSFARIQPRSSDLRQAPAAQQLQYLQTVELPRKLNRVQI